jgi:hypothetical protein
MVFLVYFRKVFIINMLSTVNQDEGSIPFTRSNVYRGFLTFAGFCISFASACFPPPEMLQAGWLFPALPFLSRTRGLGQFFQGKIACVGCNDTTSL